MLIFCIFLLVHSPLSLGRNDTATWKMKIALLRILFCHMNFSCRRDETECISRTSRVKTEKHSGTMSSCVQVDHEGVVHGIARLGFEGMVFLLGNSKKKKAMMGGFRGEESKENLKLAKLERLSTQDNETGNGAMVRSWFEALRFAHWKCLVTLWKPFSKNSATFHNAGMVVLLIGEEVVQRWH
eukprot:jgi/Bigna1/69451/fgenesh1_pg.9_\